MLETLIGKRDQQRIGDTLVRSMRGRGVHGERSGKRTAVSANGPRGGSFAAMPLGGARRQKC